MRGLVKGIPGGFQQNFSGLIINEAIAPETKGHQIPFTFSPTGMSDSVQASFQQTTIPGASAPQITYTSTGARVVSLSLSIPLDYLPPNSPYEDIEDYLNAFRALNYPKYSLGGGRVESPSCKLYMPNITIFGVCTQCNVEYVLDRIANDGSMSANVSLSFMEVLDNVKDVDATWIANSKARVLRNTVVTSSNYNGSSSTAPSVPTEGREEYCTIRLLGSSDVSITSNTAGLDTIMRRGIWEDPGVTSTRKDKYFVKRYCGFVQGPTANITEYGFGSQNYCICNGNRVLLNSGVSNSFCKPGETITYFFVYAPVYDVNKHEIDSIKVRYIHVTLEV